MTRLGRHRGNHKARLHTALKKYVGMHHEVDQMFGLATQAITFHRKVRSHDHRRPESCIEGNLNYQDSTGHVTCVSLDVRSRWTGQLDKNAKIVRAMLRKNSCMHRRPSYSFVDADNSNVGTTQRFGSPFGLGKTPLSSPVLHPM